MVRLLGLVLYRLVRISMFCLLFIWCKVVEVSGSRVFRFVLNGILKVLVFSGRCCSNWVVMFNREVLILGWVMRRML